MTRRQTIGEWLEEAINDKEDGKVKCDAVAVIHYVGEQQTVIDKITLGGALSVKDIAQRFDKKVAQYVHDLPGQQTCALLAFYDGSQDPAARLPFTRMGQITYPNGATESPTDRGLVQQLMRHLEAKESTLLTAQRQMVDGFSQLLTRVMDQNTALAAEAERLRGENADAYRIISETTMGAAERSLDRDMALIEKRKSEILQAKLVEWLPALTNTILQKKVFPENTEDSAIINGLIEAMGPEQISLFIS